MGTMKVYGIGKLGVNTDSDPWSIDDHECLQMQNALNNPLGVLAQRPGFSSVNLTAAPGAILGGVGVPLLGGDPSGGDGDGGGGGGRMMYIGRGPLTE
jgi:hypothetical protein